MYKDAFPYGIRVLLRGVIRRTNTGRCRCARQAEKVPSLLLYLVSIGVRFEIDTRTSTAVLRSMTAAAATCFREKSEEK